MHHKLIWVCAALHCISTVQIWTYELNDEEVKTVLQHHNRIRSQVAEGLVPQQPSASNMRKMNWNTEQAEKASRKALQCAELTEPGYNVAVIQNPDEENDLGGQILEAAVVIETAIQRWFMQHEHFSFPDKCSSAAGCSAYKQMVSARVEFLGCALTECVNSTAKRQHYTFVCKYDKISQPLVDDAIYKIGDPCSACPLVEAPSCSENLCQPLPENLEPSNQLPHSIVSRFYCASGLPPQFDKDDPTQPIKCVYRHVFGQGDCDRGYTCQQSPFHRPHSFCCPNSGNLYQEIEPNKPKLCPTGESLEFFEGGQFPKLCRLGEQILSKCSNGFICTKNFISDQRFYCCTANAWNGGNETKVQYCSDDEEPEFDRMTRQARACNPAVWESCSADFDCKKAEDEMLEGRFFCCPSHV